MGHFLWNIVPAGQRLAPHIGSVCTPHRQHIIRSTHIAFFAPQGKEWARHFVDPEIFVVVNEIAGEDWMTPEWFRFGASSLLNDLLLQRQKLATGAYSGADYVTLD